MTQEQQTILEQFDDSTIFSFLREIRNKAFISWGTADVVGKAGEMGFVMDEDTAIDILAEMDRRADATLGITWDTVEYYINEWIENNTFKVDIKESSTDEERTTNFCSLETNENIEEFWNDDSYCFYGISKQEIESFVGKGEMVGDCIIVKVH